MHCLEKKKKGTHTQISQHTVPCEKKNPYNSVHRKDHSGEASCNQSVEEQMMAVGRMSSTAMNRK